MGLCNDTSVAFTSTASAQVVNAVAELFQFVSKASDILGQPVGTELGGDTPRFMLEQVRPGQWHLLLQLVFCISRFSCSAFLVMKQRRDFIVS